MIPATYIIDNEQKRERLAKRIFALPLEGQVWDVTVKEWQPTRSVEANRRLWALHKAAADATGHSTEELHELMKLKFLPRSMVKVGNFEREVAGRSSRLTKQEFRDFMERVEEFYISELGVMLGEYA